MAGVSFTHLCSRLVLAVRWGSWSGPRVCAPGGWLLPVLGSHRWLDSTGLAALARAVGDDLEDRGEAVFEAAPRGV